MAVQAGQAAIKSIEISEAADAIYRFPIWPMKTLMVIGLIVSSLQCISRGLKAFKDNNQYIK